jgi:hypothetical protein
LRLAQPYASGMTVRRSNLYWQSRPHRAPVQLCWTTNAPSLAADARSIRQSDVHLTVEELEAGLQILDRLDTDKEEFWNENWPAFQATIRLAIRETAEALLLQQMSAALRDELEGQLAWLTSCLESTARH